MVQVVVNSVTFDNTLPFVLIAGPCQMESAQHGMEVASALKELTSKLGIPFVFKASFDKANVNVFWIFFVCDTRKNIF